MGSRSSGIQFGIFGYKKKDVDLKIDEYEREKELLLNEKAKLQQTVDILKEKEAQFNSESEKFDEVQRGVTSIMSVTQRAADKVFEDAYSQKDVIVSIAENAANEIIHMRKEILDVRACMDNLFEKLQNRLDALDESLNGSATKLVAVKQEVINNRVSSTASIQREVDNLMMLASQDIDVVPLTKYHVPELGKHSSTLVTDSAAKVMSSRMNAYNGIASDAPDIEELVKLTDDAQTPPAEVKQEVSEAEQPKPADSAAPANEAEVKPASAPAPAVNEPDWFANSPLIKSKNISKPVVRQAKKVKVRIKLKKKRR